MSASRHAVRNAARNTLIDVECFLCHGSFQLTDRRLREVRQRGELPACRTCKILARLEIRDPAEHYAWWLEQFPNGGLAEMLSEIFGERHHPEVLDELRSRLAAPVAA